MSRKARGKGRSQGLSPEELQDLGPSSDVEEARQKVIRKEDQIIPRFIPGLSPRGRKHRAAETPKS